MVDELTQLLAKIARSEDLVRRAELYFYREHHRWSSGVSAYFLDFLERKRDQIDYEWSRVAKLGSAIAKEELDPKR